MYQETFHLKLQKARIEAGYTQEQTAEATGIPRSTLANYERGRTQPDIETLGTLAQFYNVSTDWLIGVNVTPPIRPTPNKKKTQQDCSRL